MNGKDHWVWSVMSERVTGLSTETRDPWPQIRNNLKVIDEVPIEVTVLPLTAALGRFAVSLCLLEDLRSRKSRYEMHISFAVFSVGRISEQKEQMM